MGYCRMLEQHLLGIVKLTKQIDKTIQARLPRLWNGLRRYDLDVSLLTTQWLITLFSRGFSR